MAQLPTSEETERLNKVYHYYLPIEKPEWKFDTLMDLFDSITIGQLIIFCNSHEEAIQLLAKFTETEASAALLDTADDINNAIIHSSRVLITTNLLPHDHPIWTISGMSALVINYNVPPVEDYIHRIGTLDLSLLRNSCIRKGNVITFVLEGQEGWIENIKERWDVQVESILSPDGVLIFHG